MHAARQGQTATAKYLIEHGADLASSSELGVTALHHAAGIGALMKSLFHVFSLGIVCSVHETTKELFPLRSSLMSRHAYVLLCKIVINACCNALPQPFEFWSCTETDVVKASNSKEDKYCQEVDNMLNIMKLLAKP